MGMVHCEVRHAERVVRTLHNKQENEYLMQCDAIFVDNKRKTWKDNYDD